jgi:anti-sigma regulatory factor (Ser/Thr protein kinase)
VREGPVPRPLPPVRREERVEVPGLTPFGEPIMTQEWSSSTVLELGALPTATPCARLHAKVMLMEWGLGALIESAELLVSELMTNAVNAAALVLGPVRPPVRLRLSTDRVQVLIEVWDPSDRPPAPTEVEPTAESGRGLFLIGALSARWDWYLTPRWGGKVVWCEVGGGAVNSA